MARYIFSRSNILKKLYHVCGLKMYARASVCVVALSIRSYGHVQYATSRQRPYQFKAHLNAWGHTNRDVSI